MRKTVWLDIHSYLFWNQISTPKFLINYPEVAQLITKKLFFVFFFFYYSNFITKITKIFHTLPAVCMCYLGNNLKGLLLYRIGRSKRSKASSNWLCIILIRSSEYEIFNRQKILRISFINRYNILSFVFISSHLIPLWNKASSIQDFKTSPVIQIVKDINAEIKGTTWVKNLASLHNWLWYEYPALLS